MGNTFLPRFEPSTDNWRYLDAVARELAHERTTATGAGLSQRTVYDDRTGRAVRSQPQDRVQVGGPLCGRRRVRRGTGGPLAASARESIRDRAGGCRGLGGLAQTASLVGRAQTGGAGRETAS